MVGPEAAVGRGAVVDRRAAHSGDGSGPPRARALRWESAEGGGRAITESGRGAAAARRADAGHRYREQGADLRDDRALRRGGKSGAPGQLVSAGAVRDVRSVGSDEPGAAVARTGDRGVDAGGG